jgi:hypothetical protein
MTRSGLCSCTYIPVEVDGEGRDDDGADEVAVGEEDEGLHADVERELGEEEGAHGEGLHQNHARRQHHRLHGPRSHHRRRRRRLLLSLHRHDCPLSIPSPIDHRRRRLLFNLVVSSLQQQAQHGMTAG